MARVTTTALDLGHHRWVAENTESLSRDELAAAHKTLLTELERIAVHRAPTIGPVTPARHVGELIGALKNHHADCHVMVSAHGRRSFAGRCGSYPGYPGEVAIAPDGHHPTTVAELITDLKGLLRTGVRFTLGTAIVDEQTPLWVSGPDEASHQQVTGIRLDGDTVIITTAAER